MLGRRLHAPIALIVSTYAFLAPARAVGEGQEKACDSTGKHCICLSTLYEGDTQVKGEAEGGDGVALWINGAALGIVRAGREGTFVKEVGTLSSKDVVKADLVPPAQGATVSLTVKPPSAESGVMGFGVGTVLAKLVVLSANDGSTIDPETLGRLGCLKTTRDGRDLIFLPNPASLKGRFLRPAAWIEHFVEPAWGKRWPITCVDCGSDAVLIPYGSMRVLSRGQVQRMGHPSSESFEAFGAIGGGAAVVSALGNLHHSTRTWTVSVGAAVLLIAGAAYLNRRTLNYITILYGPPRAETAAGKVPDSDNLYSACQVKAAKCAVVSFQIIDPNDYWNTSKLLSAKTGLEFIDTAAQKGAAASR